MPRHKGGKVWMAEGCPQKMAKRNAEMGAYRFVMAIMFAMLHFSEDDYTREVTKWEED